MPALQWGQNNASNQIREAVWAGWRVFVQERAFISGKHSQEVRFGIVHPIPAFHRKFCIKSNWKTPEDISVLSAGLTGSTGTQAAKSFIWNPPPSPSFKRTGSMEESNDPGRRLVPVAAAQPARANSPDDPRLRYGKISLFNHFKGRVPEVYTRLSKYSFTSHALVVKLHLVKLEACTSYCCLVA